jgi:branched-subunit amino acid transport protein
MSDAAAMWTVLGLGVVTFITRGLFLMPRAELPIPAWLERVLAIAPLAALTAVIVPEIVMTAGELSPTWQDARFPAVLAATAFYRWRPGVLGPMLAGLALYLPLRIFAGW